MTYDQVKDLKPDYSNDCAGYDLRPLAKWWQS
jgi:hypothetical protein